jgi:hypothetical protein
MKAKKEYKNGEVPEFDDEPGIAMENQLKIKELSEKVIEILTSHLLSTVWHGCSKNTYGAGNIVLSLTLFSSPERFDQPLS